MIQTQPSLNETLRSLASSLPPGLPACAVAETDGKHAMVSSSEDDLQLTIALLAGALLATLQQHQAISDKAIQDLPAMWRQRA